MIELTVAIDGTTIWLNPRFIIAMWTTHKGETLIKVSGGEEWTVKETVADIQSCYTWGAIMHAVQPRD